MSSPLLGTLQLMLRRRRRFRVSGNSMEPTYRDGDHVLVDPHAYRRGAPAPGDVVLSRHPLRGDVHVLKRVAAIRPDGRLDLAGDNPRASTDSRSFGGVRADLVVGRVTGRYP